jgi:hypothetical protein
MAKHYPTRLSMTLSLIMTLVNVAGWLGMGRINIAYMVRSAIVLFLLCLACCRVIFLILRTSPTRSRWLDPVLAAACCGCLSSAVYFSMQWLFPEKGDDPISRMPVAMRFGMFFYMGITLDIIIYPVGWFFEKLRRAQRERLALEHLKEENLMVRLGCLQQQMSPHFLFNCLNVLKSGTKEEWAKEYILQLSRVYRYLLSISHGTRLVSVEGEIRFINDYVLVLRRRFEGAIRLSLDPVPGADNRYMPPLALQTLVESAIARNEFSAAAALRIRIYTEGEWLVVQNNVLPGGSGGEDDHRDTGLHSLRERYRLLGSISPVLIREASVFTIKLPLFHDPGTHIRG